MDREPEPVPRAVSETNLVFRLGGSGGGVTEAVLFQCFNRGFVDGLAVDSGFDRRGRGGFRGSNRVEHLLIDRGDLAVDDGSGAVAVVEGRLVHGEDVDNDGLSGI